MKPKQKEPSTKVKLIISFWIALALLSFSTLMTGLYLKRITTAQNKLYATHLTLTEQSQKLFETTDDLTDEIRGFTVTGNPEYLDHYWARIQILQTREKIIETLKQLQIPAEEINLMTQAVRNSEKLQDTEIRAIKLILTAYQIPQQLTPSTVQAFELPLEDQKLNAGQKIMTAQKIMFDDRYLAAKEEIYTPIKIFQIESSKRFETSLQKSQNNFQTIYTLLILQITLIFSGIISSVWLRLLLLKEKK